MIGYIIEQELGNLLPFERPFATLLTMIEVDPDDPAFKDPTKFVGPVYDKEAADELAAQKGWTFKQDGDKWRRVVASPMPRQIFALDPIRWLLEKNTIVVCSGGGGIPTAYAPDGTRTLLGVEAVIDKDWASELLARELAADIFVIATDTDGVYLDWGTPEARKLERTTPSKLAGYSFPAGSMGPKVEAACHFVKATGHRAAIGALKDIERIVAGDAGTQVLPD
jgi:carbamate kinase